MYHVVRTHSHTDRQLLWKVFSREIVSLSDAFNLKKNFEKSESNKSHEYFVVQKVDDSNQQSLHEKVCNFKFDIELQIEKLNHLIQTCPNDENLSIWMNKRDTLMSIMEKIPETDLL